MANLLGVDFGTTSLKACLFDENGKMLITKSIKYELITKGEFIEFPAEEFFNNFLKVFNEITSEYKVDALSVDTQGETLIILDADGNPLMNAIIWLDNRASVEALEMQSEFGLEKIYNLTGQAEVPAGYPAPKIKWLKNNMPEVFNKADKFLLLEDYIIFRLTGKAVASRSLYSSSLLMNVHTGEYIPEFLDFCGIDQNKLPVLLESGEIVGEYKGVKIATSALDQIAGATGAGVVKEGIVSETTGTALALVALTKDFPAYYEGTKVSVYYMRKGLYSLLMWAPTAGATLEWFKKNFCPNEDYSNLNEMAEQVPAGAEGLICIPHLCGTVMPENNPNVKGSFFGFDLKHTRGHFVRAIMESIAYTVKEFLELIGVEPTQIRLMGGGAKSPIWCNIKSAVLEKEVVTLTQSETACLGSAIFAGVAIGVYSNVPSACDKLVAVLDKYYSVDNGYKTLYADYKKKEKNLIEIF